MHRSALPALAGVAALAVLAVLVTGRALPSQAHDSAAPAGVSQITIEVSGCETDSIAIVVRPWTAHVQRGRPLSWTTPAGVDSVVIEALQADRWPFAWERPGHRPEQPEHHRPAPRRSARGGMPIQAGNVPAHAALGTYSYRFLLYCGARVIDIDPEIIIFDPF